MGANRPPRRSEVGARPLTSGEQGRLSLDGLAEGSTEGPSEISRDVPEQIEASAGDDAADSGERRSEGPSPSDGGVGDAPDGSADDAADLPVAGGAESPLVVRVLPDVVRLDKTFDYAVPDAWQTDGRAERLQVGSIVRIRLGGRRLRGWVTELGVDPPPGVELQPLAGLSGMGPPADVVSLARWAAWRWAGRTVHLLRTASPPRVVTRPAAVGSQPQSRGGEPSGRTVHQPNDSLFERPGGAASMDSQPAADRFECSGRATSTPSQSYGDLFERPGAVTVLRNPPGDDASAVVRAAARRGDALIVVPAWSEARRIAGALRREGVRVALGFDDWAVAAAGATVVGTRAAVWLPIPRLAAVVVLDEHSESLQSEQAPTWHAREVALERARRVGAPAVLVSPVPTLEALEAGELATLDRAAEINGWPAVEVLDRRLEDPVRGGLFAEGLRDRLVAAGGRVAVVLNRKGRGRLLACKACGELARTSDGRAPMRLRGRADWRANPAHTGEAVGCDAGVWAARERSERERATPPRDARPSHLSAQPLIDEELVAADGSERRPVVCAECGSTVLRNLRMGVTRAREELAALASEPVGEITSEAGALGSERIVIGTEAVLWRLPSAALVVFLDFDQELLAPRQRASEQALALLARGARLTGGRSGGGRLVVQTRQPDHPVVAAAVRADPSIMAAVEQDRRQALGLPPYGAQARVSGPGAEAFIEALRDDVGAEVSVRGPLNGQFLLRAGTHQPLLDLLARTPRPAERLRLEVDPLRV